jgi:hypothetical protein
MQSSEIAASWAKGRQRICRRQLCGGERHQATIAAGAFARLGFAVCLPLKPYRRTLGTGRTRLVKRSAALICRCISTRRLKIEIGCNRLSRQDSTHAMGSRGADDLNQAVTRTTDEFTGKIQMHRHFSKLNGTMEAVVSQFNLTTRAIRRSAHAC